MGDSQKTFNVFLPFKELMAWLLPVSKTAVCGRHLIHENITSMGSQLFMTRHKPSLPLLAAHWLTGQDMLSNVSLIKN